MLFKPELEKDDDDMEPIINTNAWKLFHEQPDRSYLKKVYSPVMYDLVLQHRSVGL